MSLSECFQKRDIDYVSPVKYKKGLAEIRDGKTKMIVDVNTGDTEVLFEGLNNQVIAYNYPSTGEESSDLIADKVCKGSEMINEIYNHLGIIDEMEIGNI